LQKIRVEPRIPEKATALTADFADKDQDKNLRKSAVKRDPETYAVIGAAMEVHKELGSGFLESVYQDALEIECRQRDIAFSREHNIPVTYKGIALGAPYRCC